MGTQVSQLFTVSCTIDPRLQFYDVLHKTLFIFYFGLLFIQFEAVKVLEAHG